MRPELVAHGHYVVCVAPPIKIPMGPVGTVVESTFEFLEFHFRLADVPGLPGAKRVICEGVVLEANFNG